MRLDLTAPPFLREEEEEKDDDDNEEIFVFVACTTRDPKNLRNSASALRWCSETPRRYEKDCPLSWILLDSCRGKSLKKKIHELVFVGRGFFFCTHTESQVHSELCQGHHHHHPFSSSSPSALLSSALFARLESESPC